MIRRPLGVLLVGLTLATSACTSPTSTSTGPSAANTPSRQTHPAAVDGSSSLPARWWAWTESVPSSRNPIDDPTGARCALRQPADVWFLAGTHGGAATRRCTIPAGRPVYLPVLNRICTVADGRTAAAAMADCTGKVDVATASVDGRPVRPSVATSGTAFRLVAAARSTTGFSAGPHQAVTWGVWIGPIPLTVGRHVLKIDGRTDTFTTCVEYRITVTRSTDLT